MDKNTYRILRFINSGKGIKPYNMIMSRFKKQLIPSVDDSLHILITDRMIGIGYADVNEIGCPVNPSNIKITAKGKEFIEFRKSQKFADWFARILAIIALAVSIGNAIVTVLAYLSNE